MKNTKNSLYKNLKVFMFLIPIIVVACIVLMICTNEEIFLWIGLIVSSIPHMVIGIVNVVK